MVKTAFDDGFDSSRFVLSTTTFKEGKGEYRCKGRIVQSRGTLLEDGELDWEDKSITVESVGDNPTLLDTLVLDRLWQYLIARGYSIFEEEAEDNEEI